MHEQNKSETSRNQKPKIFQFRKNSYEERHQTKQTDNERKRCYITSSGIESNQLWPCKSRYDEPGRQWQIVD